MGKSNALRLADVRAAFRLVGDCRDLGHDGGRWRARLTAGLTDLVHGTHAIGLEAAPAFAAGAPAGPSHFPARWPADAYALWHRLYLVERAAPRDVSFRRFFAVPGRRAVRHRRQLVADPDWYPSEEVVARRRPLGVDDLLMSRLPHAGGLFVFCACRPTGDRGFDARQVKVVALSLVEVGRLIGGPLAADPGGPAAGLPARTRQVLGLLLGGASEKEAARELGISPHTVHGHVKAAHRHLGVRSRGELLARFVARPAGP